MKLLPLGNKPNISSTNHGSNVSMELDSRGHPHITWFENKNGHNEIHYTFWDGQQWTCHNQSMVGWADELVSSGNSILLDSQEKPYIVFSRKLPDSQSAISLVTTEDDKWILDELDVNYDITWVGILRYDYNIYDSSSSYTSSSSSSNNSSSSSVDSSSSSSGNDAKIFIVALDSDHILRIYSISTFGWNLLSEKEMIYDNIYPLPPNIKISMCSNYMGVTWNFEETICYNFFNLNSESWLYDDSRAFVIPGLVSVDSIGYKDIIGKMAFGMIKSEGSTTQIINKVISTNGSTSYLGNTIIESEDIKVYGNNSFISSGYSNISIAYDTDLDEFNVLGFGARLAKYNYNGVIWSKEYVSIEGISEGIYSDKIITKSHNNLLGISFSNNNIYFYCENDTEDTFKVASPEISAFTGQRLYVAPWTSYKLNGDEIRCTWSNRVGDMLRESVTKVNVIISDKEDPDCYTSSSSSSSTSLSSSSSTSLSSSSSTSLSSISSSSTSESSESSISSISSESSQGYSTSSSSSSYLDTIYVTFTGSLAVSGQGSWRTFNGGTYLCSKTGPSTYVYEVRGGSQSFPYDWYQDKITVYLSGGNYYVLLHTESYFGSTGNYGESVTWSVSGSDPLAEPYAFHSHTTPDPTHVDSVTAVDTSIL